MSGYVVEVDQAPVHFTRQGAGAWEYFRLRQPERVTDLPSVVPGGGIALVSCRDEDEADELAARFLDAGLPKTAVKVRREQTEAAR